MKVTVSGWVHAAEQGSLTEGGSRTCVHMITSHLLRTRRHLLLQSVVSKSTQQLSKHFFGGSALHACGCGPNFLLYSCSLQSNDNDLKGWCGDKSADLLVNLIVSQEKNVVCTQPLGGCMSSCVVTLPQRLLPLFLKSVRVKPNFGFGQIVPKCVGPFLTLTLQSNLLFC